MKLNLTSLERKAVVKIMFDIAYADGDFTDSELDMIAVIGLKVLGVSSEEVKESIKMGVVESFNILKELTHNEKETLIAIMIEMINADGKIHPNEVEVLATVRLAIGV